MDKLIDNWNFDTLLLMNNKEKIYRYSNITLQVKYKDKLIV